MNNNDISRIYIIKQIGLESKRSHENLPISSFSSSSFSSSSTCSSEEGDAMENRSEIKVI